MSSKGKTPKKKYGSDKPNQRKSISPIQNSELSSGTTVSQSGSCDPLSVQWLLYSISPNNDQQKERVRLSSPECYQFRPFVDSQTNLANMPMNFHQMILLVLLIWNPHHLLALNTQAPVQPQTCYLRLPGQLK